MAINLCIKGNIRQPLIFLVVAVSILAALTIVILRQHSVEVDVTKEVTAQNQKSHIATLKEENVKAPVPQQPNIQAQRRKLVEQLQNFYAESMPIFNANLQKDISTEDFDKFESTFDEWVVRTATYIERNMGEAAKARFLDYGPGYSSTFMRAVNEKHNAILNLMWAYQKNLTMLIRSNAWDKLDETGAPVRAGAPSQPEDTSATR